VAIDVTRAFYLDASAIVKLVVGETATAALVGHIGDASLITSEISEVEVPRAAYLRTGAEATVRHAEEVLARFNLVPLDEEIRRDAARARPAELRSLDAIHLASCLRVAKHIEAVVVYDKRLAKALRAQDLRVDAPE
jgi:predicted nucleic acid-binding protein